MIASLIGTYEIVKEVDVLLPARTVVGICPHCGKEVVKRKKGWFCENRDCRFALCKENAFFSAIGKKLTKDTAEKLLSSGKVHLTGCGVWAVSRPWRQRLVSRQRSELRICALHCLYSSRSV